MKSRLCFFLLAALAAASRGAADDQPASAPQQAEQTDLRAAAKSVLEQLRMVESAVDQWAIEHNKATGVQATAKDIAPYFKPGTRLRKELDEGQCSDVLGNPIWIPAVDRPPALSRKTFERLKAVVPEGYWKPFKVEDAE